MGFYPSPVELSYSRLTNNVPPRIPTKDLFVCWICLLSLFPMAINAADANWANAADKNWPAILCPNTNLDTTSTYAPNSTYQTNLNTLLSTLSSNSSNTSNGFYNFTAGSSPPDVAYGLFLCRGDASAAVCRDCVADAAVYAVQQCPGSKRVTLWYTYCMLRYDNVSMFGISDTSTSDRNILDSGTNVTNATLLADVLGEVMDHIVSPASRDDSGKKFATAKAKYSSSPLTFLYGLAQCTPDLSDLDCTQCLRDCVSAFRSMVYGKAGARVLYPSCYARYELNQFYSNAAPPQNSSVLPSSPPPSSPGRTHSNAAQPPNSSVPPSSPPSSSPGKRGVSSPVIAAIVVSIGVIVMAFVAGFCFLTRRLAKKKSNSVKEDNVGDDISEVQSLQYELGTIQDATKKFSDTNKIGAGGFGPVYKGLLPNGKEVAIKRLSQTSGQGAQEFKIEVVLLAKLQHRNLVRLLGYCLGEGEKILVYEFLPNKSLDYFLFDPHDQEKLNWSRRYKIIGGIARGMMYLHEDSRLTIIHRDLKASNILLDADMIAKVSDFGLARIVGNDQTHAQTSHCAGTFGYISPEYMMHGQFSTKSDVFSFGVLVLEIISGKKNNYYHSDDVANLVSYAWKLWREGTPLDLLDTNLEGSNASNEVNRCIHIALLCVQDDPATRPPMTTVVLMLNTDSFPLSLPQQPRYLVQREEELNSVKGLHLSVNEASMSEVYPR